MLRTLAAAACAACATGSPEDACRLPTMMSRWQWLSNTGTDSGSGGLGILLTPSKVTSMRFGILGSTRAWGADGADVPLGGRSRRALLALLLIRPGEVVPHDRLIDVLYGEQPPKNAQHALHSQVSRLRGDGIMVERAATGYRLAGDPGDVDAVRVLRLGRGGGGGGRT